VQNLAVALMLSSVITVINILPLTFLIQDFTFECVVPTTLTVQMAVILSTGDAQQMDYEYVG
jgi:hypothetical protein